MVLALMLGSTVGAFAAAPTFNDIKTTNWAYNYVAELSNRGAIQGYPDGSFKPSGTITVAEFVKITVSLIDQDHQPVEWDKHWASGYMHFAEVLHIVPEGMFERTDWNKPITRQQMGVIMERAATEIYQEKTVTDTSKLNEIKAQLKDYNQICDNCKDAVVQAVARGIIAGYTDGTFKPTNTATRAEASAMIIRLIEEKYRVFNPAQLQESGIVKEGTDMRDITSDEKVLRMLEGSVAKYVILADTSKFNLVLLSEKDTTFTVQYTNVGTLTHLDSEGNSLGVIRAFYDYGTIYNFFKGKVKDTGYFLMLDLANDIAWLMPNDLY